MGISEVAPEWGPGHVHTLVRVSRMGGVVGHFTVAEFSQATQMGVVLVLLLQVRGFGPRAWRGHQTSRPLTHPDGRPAVSVHSLRSGAGAPQRPDSLLPGPSHPTGPQAPPSV